MTRFLKKHSALVLLFIVSVLFFLPVLIAGDTFYAFDALLHFYPWKPLIKGIQVKNTLITDPVNVYYPYLQFIKDNIFRLSFWNPYLLGGLPQYPHLNPVFLTTLVMLPVTVAHDLMLWLHLFGAGAMMFFYLRALGLKDHEGLAGAAAWMFNGYLMVWFEFESNIMMAVYLPGMLYAFEKWLISFSWRSTALFILFAGLFVTTDNAHLLIYQVLFLACYVFFRLQREFSRLRKKHFYHIVAVFILGLMISCNFIAGNYEAVSEGTSRKPYAFHELFEKTGELPGAYLATMIFPDFFGNPTSAKTFTPRENGKNPYNNYNELCIYLGVFPFFAALTSLFGIRREPFVFFFFLTAVTSLTMSMGSFLYYPLARFVPGLSFSTPTRILCLFGFSGAALTGFGMKTAKEIKESQPLFISLLSLSMLGLLIFILFMQTNNGINWAKEAVGWLRGDSVYDTLRSHYQIGSRVIYEPLLYAILSAMILIGLAFASTGRMKTYFMYLGIAVTILDLMAFGLKYNTFMPRKAAYPKTGVVAFLEKKENPFRIITIGPFMHNAFMSFKIRDAGGYASFYNERYGRVILASQKGNPPGNDARLSRWVSVSRVGSPLLDIMNIGYLLLPAEIALDNGNFKKIYDREIAVYENKNAFPAAFFVPGYLCVDGGENALKKAMMFTLEDFTEKAILEELPPEIPDRVFPIGPIPETDVELISYKPGEVKLRVNATTDGMIILSENYHKDWKVFVNGASGKVMRADYVMMGTPIQKGGYDIVFRFQSETRLIGMGVTCLGWLFTFLLLSVAVIRKK